ncbi:hypothetical protein MAH1_35190 [Sessilibacter sp. MAH1]
MKYNILVGTHHKTGTVWMHGVFFRLAKLIGCEMFNISDEHLAKGREAKIQYLQNALDSSSPQIIYDHHSKFPLGSIDCSGFRGIRMVRDPRDLIISSAKYHCWSDEEWLHQPLDRFNGLTYAEKINTFKTMNEKIIFEMDNSAGGQIHAMMSFDGMGVIETVRYEDLIDDFNFDRWFGISRFLGLEREEVIYSLRSFYDNSIFGKKEKSNHIQSGESRQYLDIFTDDITSEFNQRFPNALAKLGYIE